MDGNYSMDRTFGNSCMQKVKAILGQFLLQNDCVEEDINHNTDLVVLEMGTQKIAVRIRRNPYLAQYGTQFTIRYKRPSGSRTEFQKIMEGWGDYLFYGFTDETGQHIEKWLIGDSKAFRRYIIRQMKNGWSEFEADHTMINGAGNGSTFLYFDQDEIPGFVAASSENWGG